MRPWPAACGLAAGVLLPAGWYLAGGRGWPLGLWAGAVLGLGHALWVRHSVTRAFAPESGRPPLGVLLGNSVVRTAVAAVVIVGLIKLPGIPLWGVLLGYTLAQAGAAWWTRRRPPGRTLIEGR
jgi:hypothetical protein